MMMKQLIFIIAILILPISMVQAQDITFGAKAGLNLATLQPTFTKNRTSIHLGGVVEIPLMDSFSIQPELLYSGQGAKDQKDSNGDEIYKIDYLALPVMAKYYVWETLSVEAGPRFGILLSAKREDNGETEDIKDITKSTNIGVALGLGYKLPSGINFGVRYFFGSDINDIDEDSTKIQNRVIQISMGYFFW